MANHAAAWKARYAESDEKIVATCSGYIGRMMGKGREQQHNGALIVTDRRVAFYRKGLLGTVHEQIPLAKITSVEERTLLGHRVLRLHTSHDALEFKTFDAAGYGRVSAAIRAVREQDGDVEGVAAAEAVADPLEQLRKLGDLRAAGVVTEEEFAAKKAELLGRV